MRKTLTVLTALVALLLVGLGPAAAARPLAADGVLTPSVQAILDALAPGEMTTVVVTLREKSNLTAVRGATRAARLKDTIRVLRATADSSQVAIRARLRVQAGLGKVARTTPLWVVNGVTVTATAEVIRDLAARADVASITADAIVVVPAAGAAEPNLATVGAPALWELGQTGQGVVVASLDSGVDLSHPDLAGRWRGGSNSWFDPYAQHPTTPTDLSGHGTATMGLIVGGDAGGSSIGMAPGARWIAAKIFNDQGAATATAIHQAFQWVLDPDHDPSTADAPQVVNASWSIGSGPGCDLSFRPDVQALLAAGILPVFAAGNYGSGAGTAASPANYPESLAVGALNANGLVFSASSRGPSTCGGRTDVFPDLVAPGVDVLTADRWGMYQVATGTSVAAPHVAGALALLLGAFPGTSADRQRAALLGSATDLGAAGPDSAYGHGRLDVVAAFHALASAPDLTVAAAPTDLSITAGDSATLTVQVTPVNGFSSDVPLSLSGLASTSATWSFTPSVISGGSGSAQLVIDTTAATGPGSYPLTITADGGPSPRSAGATLTVVAATPTDTLGPLTSGPSASPTLTDGSTAVLLHATASDTTTGGSAVAAAEYFLDTVGANGTGTAMTVTTAPVTDLDATIGLSTVVQLSEGAHTVYLHAKDAAGNWGPTASTSLVIDKTRPTLSGVAASPNPSQGARTVTLTATASDTASAISRVEWFTGNDPGLGNATTMSLTGTGPYTATAQVDVASRPEGPMSLTVRARDAAGNWSTATTTTLTITAPLWFSTFGNSNPPGVGGAADDADLYSWNGTAYARLFDASAAGLPTAANVDGYDRVDATHFYLSFSATNTAVPGLGNVQDEDVVYYDNGTWSLYFDGTARGLTNNNHDLDAISILGATNGTGGTLYFSTRGNTNPPGVSGTADDADLYSWNGTSLTRVWDASANGLPAAANTDGYVRIDATHFYLSFSAATTTVPGLGTVQDEDVLHNNNGTWSTYFDGTAHGLTTDNLDIDAFDTP